jgi:hypothetical protein
MAEQRLPPELLERVSVDCTAYDAERASSGQQDRLRALADELLARHAPLQVADAEDGPTAGVQHGCCG